MSFVVTTSEGFSVRPGVAVMVARDAMGVGVRATVEGIGVMSVTIGVGVLAAAVCDGLATLRGVAVAFSDELALLPGIAVLLGTSAQAVSNITRSNNATLGLCIPHPLFAY